MLRLINPTKISQSFTIGFCLISLTNYCLAHESEHISLHKFINKECPAIIVCGTSDNLNQINHALEQNNLANRCYAQIGDIEMTNLSNKATITCQTMKGSINPRFNDVEPKTHR